MRTPLLCVLLLLAVAVAHALPSCGNGELDAGETCDPVLHTCCNSTCTGTHDVTAVMLQSSSCAVRKNFAQLNPYLVDVTNTYEWLFLQTPGGSAPVLSTPHAQSTHITFNANGFYRLTVKVTTAFCGVYYAAEKSFTVTDCCGNGLIDVYEECDYSIEDNGCCDRETCTFVAEGIECPGTINDQCTQSLTCNGAGECLSVEDKPFNLVPLQAQSVVDTACATDVRLFSFQSGFNDPLDSTPGSYYWSVSVIAQWPVQHRVISAAGSLAGPSGIVTFGVKMMGGGYFYARLDLSDPCGLTKSLYYNVTRTCCGNMVLNTGESCDDGNTQNGDYCSSDCSRVTGECGDAIVQSNELCDHGVDQCCGPSCMSILPASTMCRQSNGDCDLPEFCTGVSASCPVDSYKTANTTCRNAVGSCDSPETCSGSDPRCPNQNAPFPSTVLCRDRDGDCDVPTYCDGLSYGCPAKEYRNTTCRRKSSFCDAEEVCVFGNVNCPADSFLSNETVCAIDGTPCVPAQCSGVDGDCIIASLPQFCSPDGPLTPVPDELSTCLNVSCIDSLCYADIANNTCFIDGVCFSHGDADPGNPCQFCNTTASTSAWSTHVDGAPCKTLSLEGPCSALTDICLSGVCVDQYRAPGFSCRASQGLCDLAEVCTGDSDFCPQDVYRNSTTICQAAADVCDIEETCTGFSPFCPTDRVQPASTLCRAKQGPCDIVEVCDGVHKSCPADSFLDSSEMCRPPRGECDKEEYCSGEDALCPEDEHYDSDFVCRPAASDCDREETCTGTGIHCPPDEYADSSYMCRPSKDLCDRPEMCTGNSIHCPIDQKYPSGTPCRPPQGACDIGETCTGGSDACPPDVLRPSSFECRPSQGPCDRPERCTGVDAACPPNTFRGPSFVCRAKRGLCDKEEFCIFNNASCPRDQFFGSELTCRPADGACDIDEVCPGDRGACPPDLKKIAGTMCRESQGECDREERCDGVASGCPQDVFEPSTTICRASTDSVCDPPEMCTGNAPTCPLNDFTPDDVPCRYPVDDCDRMEYCDGAGSCPADAYHDSSFVCHTAKTQCDANFTCTGSSPSCPYDAQFTNTFACEADGKPCTTDQCNNGVCATVSQSCGCSTNSQCSTPYSCVVGTCVGGQCQSSVAVGTCFVDGQCMSANGVNPRNPCQICKPTLSQLMWIPRPAGTSCSTDTPVGECSAQDTCNSNGVCVDRQLTGEVCRPALSDCDEEERCVSGNEHCPPDEYMSDDVVCRPKEGDCDVRERCTGLSPYCPTDMFASVNTTCRAARSLCDKEEVCSGTSRHCPADERMPRGTICRAASDACDKEEKCDGDSSDCPADAVQPHGWECRPAEDLCDRPETCNGVSKVCPADVVWPSGTVCRPADDLCDEPETCNGVLRSCPIDRFSSPLRMCRPAAGPCDVAEFCTNTSASCPSDQVMRAGITCRSAVDLCDRAEMCTGTSKLCPPNLLHNNTHVCRPAHNKCDIAETCSGDSVRCPIDARRPDGYPCADFSFCNGDEVCIDGECTVSAAARSCARPELCSLDRCDEEIDHCVHTDLATVGQACYTGPNGTAGVGVCRAGIFDCDDVSGDVTCRGEVTPRPVEYCGNEKDDNCNGLVDENCHVGPCSTNEECESSPIDRCHVGRCNSRNRCVYDLLPGFCFIDDRCYATNEFQRHNPCRRCFPLVNVFEWTENNNANVSDFNVCNGGEFCRDGKVFVDPPPLDCSYLNTPCTSGRCDANEGCYREVTPDGRSCAIPGARCSVDFQCRAGACVCDGKLDVDSDRQSLIFGLVFGLTMIGASVVVLLYIYREWESKQPANYVKMSS